MLKKFRIWIKIIRILIINRWIKVRIIKERIDDTIKELIILITILVIKKIRGWNG